MNNKKLILFAKAGTTQLIDTYIVIWNDFISFHGEGNVNKKYTLL